MLHAIAAYGACIEGKCRALASLKNLSHGLTKKHIRLELRLGWLVAMNTFGCLMKMRIRV